MMTLGTKYHLAALAVIHDECVLAAEHDLLVPVLPVDYSDLLNSRCTQYNKPQWAASVYREFNVI